MIPTEIHPDAVIVDVSPNGTDIVDAQWFLPSSYIFHIHTTTERLSSHPAYRILACASTTSKSRRAKAKRQCLWFARLEDDLKDETKQTECY